MEDKLVGYGPITTETSGMVAIDTHNGLRGCQICGVLGRDRILQQLIIKIKQL